VDWNPHFFIYPSLTIYLHFFLQRATRGNRNRSRALFRPRRLPLAFEADPTVTMLLAPRLQVACDLTHRRRRDAPGPPAAAGSAVAAGLWSRYRRC
jgi:hypothetical protein